MAKVRWLGHATFVIKMDGKTVLVDPWITNPLSPYRSIEGFAKDHGRVDVVVVTHDHGDHVGEAVEVLKAYGDAKIVALYELAEDIARKAKAIDRMVAVNIGGPTVVENITFVFTEAVHSSSLAHPSGVVIISNDCSIYHAGDTGVFLDMKLIGELYKPSVAMLPIGGRFTMGVREAVKAIELINPRHVIPMHYNTFDVIKADVELFVKLVRETMPEVKPIVLRPGEEVEIR